MKDKEWTFERPEGMREGPWSTEPDKAQWVDPKTGLPCLVRRGGTNAWCGYVGVSKGHPFFEKEYRYELCRDIDVHGGLTFSGHCMEDHSGVCHEVEEGEDDNVWWLGFDCAHCYDALPFWAPEFGFASIFGDPENDPKVIYKTYEWVKAETTRLAEQLAEVGKR